MKCERCYSSGKPGFVMRGVVMMHTEGRACFHLENKWEPCPECMGTGIQHCCDGLCEQPTVMRHSGIQEDDI